MNYLLGTGGLLQVANFIIVTEKNDIMSVILKNKIT